MGAAARQRALRTFHPNVVMHQIEALFQSSRKDAYSLRNRFRCPALPVPA